MVKGEEAKHERNWKVIEKGDKKTRALMDRENLVGSMHWKLE